jgi:hypothetical protein
MQHTQVPEIAGFVMGIAASQNVAAGAAHWRMIRKKVSEKVVLKQLKRHNESI